MTLARSASARLLTPCSVTCWLAWSVSAPRQLPDRRKHAPCRWAEKRRHRIPGLQQSAIAARSPQERVEVASAPWTVHGSALHAAADWNRHLKQATQPPQVRPARAPNGRPLSSRCRQAEQAGRWRRARRRCDSEGVVRFLASKHAKSLSSSRQAGLHCDCLSELYRDLIVDRIADAE